MGYEVIVGNVGIVHQSDNYTRAKNCYDVWVKTSLDGTGSRAAGESVTMLEKLHAGAETTIRHEHVGAMDKRGD